MRIRNNPSTKRRLISAFSLGAPLLAGCVDKGPTSPVMPVAPPAAMTKGVEAHTVALGNRLAYLWAQTASPPLNTPYAPDAQRNYNGLGLTNTVTKTNAGEYLVTLGGMAKGATGKETLIVTAYAQTKLRCVVFGWGDRGTDLEVVVNCVDWAGVPTDSRFSLLMVGENSLAGNLAFAWASDPTSLNYPAPPMYAWNPSGNPMTLFHSSTQTGAYSARLGVSSAGPETYLVSAYGSTDTQCAIGFWNAGFGSVTTNCFDHAGVPADGLYTVLHLDQGRPGKRFGFALANQQSSPTPYAPDPAFSASTGGAITITRTQKGVYTVDFTGLQKPVATRTENVQVSAMNTGFACTVPAWPKTPSGTGLRVWVVCRNGAGAVADSYFTVVVLE
ncbi:MAG: hypothetical protein U0163_02925 [Gemmatimonadaceae bacterium]